MRTSRWTSAIVGLSVVSLAACSSDRSSGIASTDNAAPEVFSVGSAAVSGALKATNLKVKLFETIPRLEARMQRAGIRQNLVNSPYDLTDNGGPVVTHSAEWNVYVNCPTAPSCWSTGNLTPAVFLRDFDRSSMIQIANQYLHEDAFARFRQVNELATSFTFAVDTADNTPTASVHDIVSILAGAVSFTGQTGYTNEYHIFLPSGTNMCLSATTCYSPNNGATFVFCAFHSSVNFQTQSGSILHVLFSVEPYQFVPGCVLPQQTRVIDGTASTLSHEFTETITDPDGDAWINDLTGNEIGDLCFTFRNPENVDGTTYVIQEEYSNTVHACTDGAF
jgi:hypothetical protein